MSKEETAEIIRYNGRNFVNLMFLLKWFEEKKFKLLFVKFTEEAETCLRVDETIFKVENRFRCTKDTPVGLLSKIVLVIKQEPFSASFRFQFCFLEFKRDC